MKMKQQYSSSKTLLAASFMLLSSCSEARITEIKQSLLFVPHNLGDVALLHSEEKGFCVKHKGREHPVDDFLLDSQLQGISSDALDAFLQDGLISVIPHDSGEFELEACHSEAGKGPITGMIAYYAVKGIAWGVVMYGAAGANGLVDKAIVGLKAAEVGEILGFGLTQGASQGVRRCATAIKTLSPAVAPVGAAVATAGGIYAAHPVIETLSLTAYYLCAFLPGF